MARKARKQLYIEARQEKILKRRGKELDVSEVELISQGLDLVLARGESPVPDPHACEEERAFIRERAKIPALGGERSWAFFVRESNPCGPDSL